MQHRPGNPSRHHPRAAYAQASERMTWNMLDEAAQEGVGAIVEKRTPRWND